ncbi:hypothetical protein R3P38DRAFT_2768362 [Favolaschia claudopus]|uniref:F-box domain-containing protein n=1 Tax=Favolaschia claudopus TaxID=2862362 RepID=A0AAW0CWI6_9AGAR
MSLEFPNEVWLHIFSLVSDGPSLKAIILSSRRFHDLALPELLRSVGWNSAEKAEAHLDFFERRVDCRKVPTRFALTLRFEGDTQSESVTTIVGRISWFANLRTLSFTNASLDGLFYTTLSQLPRLTDLSLDSCYLASPPLAVPPTPLQNSSPLAVNLDIPVTHLALTSLSTSQHTYSFYRDLLGLLRNVVSLTLTDQLPHLVDVLPALHSLSICASSDEGAASLLNRRYLPSIGSRLLHLRVNVQIALLDFRTTPVAPAQLVELSAPLLQSFRGSLYLANCLIPTSPNLSSITISTVVKKTRDALALIEAVSAAPIEEIELGVEDWDDEVLLGVTHRLPSCRQIKLFFYYSQPSDDFLFNLGIHHLPCLPHLHTLHVHVVPILPSPLLYDLRRRHYLPRTEETRIPAVEPEEEKCEEYLAVWKKYNPTLRAVKFVKGREWRREGEGGRWFVWSLEDVAEHEGDGVEEEIEEWFEDEDEGGGLVWESGADWEGEMDSEEA